jgi:hypothetical protein
MVAEFRKRLALSKRRSQTFYMKRFNLDKLKVVEGEEQYHVEVSNRFAVLEDFDAEVDINSDQEAIGQNIKMSF